MLIFVEEALAKAGVLMVEVVVKPNAALEVIPARTSNDRLYFIFHFAGYENFVVQI